MKEEIIEAILNSIIAYDCDDEDIEHASLQKPIEEYIKDIAGVSDELKCS